MCGRIANARVWCRAFGQAATALGLAMIALIWVSVERHLASERDNTERLALVGLQNIARVFEAHVIHSVQENDRMLVVLRTAYEKDPEHFDFAAWTNDPAFRNDLARQFTITDARGILVKSSAFPIAGRINVGHLDHFGDHMERREDRLRISAPVIGWGDRQLSVQLTRRLSKPDGSFAGMISAAVKPEYFSRVYDSIDVGRRGAILLAGFDGVIRASAGLNGSTIGGSIIGTAAFQGFRREPDASYVEESRLDGVRRLVSYRVVEGYPLLVMVGAAEQEVFDAFARKQWIYRLAAAGLAVVILIVIAAAARHRLMLDRARQDLGAQFDKFQTALDNMSQGLAMFDADHRLVVCNTRYRELYGFESGEVQPGTPLAELTEMRIAKGLYAGATPEEYRRRLSAPRTSESTEILHFKGGRSIALTRRPMPGGGWVSTHDDVTERQRIEAQVAHMATHDALTDLANRVLVRQKLDEALVRLRSSGKAFAVLSIDLDRFKFINDTLGHPFGDRLLRIVASRLRGCVRDGDTVGRIGGDEFAIVHRAMRCRQEVADLADTVLRVLTRPYPIDGNDLVIGASIGVATAPHDGTDADQLCQNADIALYRAKAEGRNKCLFFESAMNASVVERRDLENALRGALVRGEFELFYQPIIDLATDTIGNCEALLRWRRPGHGLVLPGGFIPVCEEIGLIAPLGEWVLRQACAEAARWPAGVRVSVNLSPAQFKSGNIAGIVMGALASSGLPPERLELEITETVLLQESEQNLAMLHQLRGMGVRIAFDDFGIGYSSLSYLTAFPFDSIKIDRHFIRDVVDEPTCRAIVDAVGGVGRSLAIETVAEGIEREDQLGAVRAAGCTNAQGFFIALPQPASDLDQVFTAFRMRQRVA